tara:strand:- start:141 stop:386 length:246 start_codon:yes stop_codon:yes gene_type:complete
MSYENTLEKVILRLDVEEKEKEKDKRIAELEKKQRDIIKGIKLCFGYAVASDNTLVVNVDAYNLLVTTCNNREETLKGQNK